MKNNLQIKDLVTIGIFAIIYFVLSFLVAILGMVPILLFAIPFVLAVIAGTPVMLFMAKEGKPWALFIFGMIPALGMWAMGHTYIVPLVALVFVGLAELVFRKGEFKSFKHNALAYSIFSCWAAGANMQMIFLRDRYIELQMRGGVPKETVDKLINLMSWPNMALIILSALVGGIIGAFIGKLMLKKHFSKAGII